MRLYTKIRVLSHHTGVDGIELIDGFEIIDLSLVEDGHQPGFDADGFFHLPSRGEATVSAHSSSE